MKKVLFGLLILTTLGLILAACLNPSIEAAGEASPRAVVLNDADKAVAAAVKPVVSGRTNASGKDISSNSQGAAVPGMYFFWDPKQKDNGYLKVDAFMFDIYESFVLTTKEANKYWDFLIKADLSQAKSADGCYVFFIPKQEKNINGVWISDYAERVLLLQGLDYTENPIDIPNPDRGFYVAWGITPGVNGGSVSPPTLTGSAGGTATTCYITYIEVNLRNFSSNAPLSGRARGPWTSGFNPDDDLLLGATYGETQPITQAALDQVKAALEWVRANNCTAILKFHYDYGSTYIDSGRWDQQIHDCEPGAPQGKLWYQASKWVHHPELPQPDDWEFIPGPDEWTEPGGDSCGIPGHEDMNWVEYHIWQFGALYREYEDCLLGCKAGMFGPWGEMHSTSYARTAVGYNWLLNAFLREVPASRTIQVHCGGVMAWHNVEYGTNYDWTNMMPPPARGTPAQRFGMFNDSYSYGLDDGWYNDNGSLSEGYKLIGDGTMDDFDRNAVLLWIRGQNNFYGGETVGTSQAYARFPNVPFEAAIAQTSHLNRSAPSVWTSFIYNEANMAPYTLPHDGIRRTPIFDPVYDGRTGMEYFRDRMGYRLILREGKTSEWVDSNGLLQYKGKIQNVGFGNVINYKNVYVILKNAATGETFTALTELDARDWLNADFDFVTMTADSRATNTAAYRDLSFSVNMKAFGSVEPGEYEIYLKINDPKETSVNRRCVRFANKGNSIWDTDIGANLIGTTIVK